MMNTTLINNSQKIFLTVLIALTILWTAGCSSNSVPTRVAKKPPAQTPPAVVSESVMDETAYEEGYVYDRRDRRDPFIPLIVPSESVLPTDDKKIGTIESYDITDFSLAAIAKKGGQYYALIISPDNKSFTILEGDVIGRSQGRVEEITAQQVTLLEYSKDYRGNLRPVRVNLEFQKGE
ncbi:MAG: pilus assembly protein PilP [Nitrospira sp.]|nr:pilus assembly protein PilP [bacterium]MBL7049007.1 pilus assembly protein PilP [Nitrospira sp.]